MLKMEKGDRGWDSVPSSDTYALCYGSSHDVHPAVEASQLFLKGRSTSRLSCGPSWEDASLEIPSVFARCLYSCGPICCL